MHSLVMVLRLIIVSVLIWAGLEKARNSSSARSALRALGAPHSVAGPAVAMITIAELSIAAGLIFMPRSHAVLAAVAALGVVFGVAGLFALWLDASVQCGCFGLSSSGLLGRRQLATLPLWIASAWVLWLERPDSPGLSDGLGALTIVSLGLAVARTIGALRATRVGRGDRLSAQEMLSWLPR